jgi:hypothetical protein
MDIVASEGRGRADLSDFRFMPLEVARLRRSTAWLICKRLQELAFTIINLFAAAWHERPARSLEDDDDVPADAAICPPERWAGVKADVMRGWFKALDLPPEPERTSLDLPATPCLSTMRANSEPAGRALTPEASASVQARGAGCASANGRRLQGKCAAVREHSCAKCRAALARVDDTQSLAAYAVALGRTFTMRSVILAGAACIVAALTAACAEPPVKPIPEAVRRSVTAISADVSGVKSSDTSRLGARGSDEGGRLGAQQGAAVMLGSGGGLLGLALAPAAAAVGGAKGAAEAQPAEVVDETRANLRLALQETDFTELLKQRLATSKAAGDIEFSTVTSGSSSAPLVTTTGTSAGHVIALEYRLNLYSEHFVNPKVGVYLSVTAQVQSPDRRQMLHSATWSYCGDRYDFVQMGANNGAAFRAQINEAAVVLGEAIPYDLYVSKQPRPVGATQLGALKVFVLCMDFKDLPSRAGKQAAPQTGPAAQPASAPLAAAAMPAASSVASVR